MLLKFFLAYLVVAVCTAAALLWRDRRKRKYSEWSLDVFMALLCGILWPVVLPMWSWYVIDNYLWEKQQRSKK